jgi:N12 class adenine-specific DNA methylase
MAQAPPSIVAIEPLTDTDLAQPTILSIEPLEDARPAPVQVDRQFTSDVHVTPSPLDAPLPPPQNVPTITRGRFTGLPGRDVTSATPEPLTDGAIQFAQGATHAAGYYAQPTDETLNGASDMIEGALKMATPLAVAAAIINLPTAVLSFGLAWSASKAASKGTEIAGGSPAAQRFAGNVAAAVVALGVGSRIVDKVRADAASVAAQARAFDAANPPEVTSNEPIPVGSGRTPAVNGGNRLPPERPGLPPAPEPEPPAPPTVPGARTNSPSTGGASPTVSIDTNAALRDLAAAEPNSAQAQTAIAALQRAGLSIEDITAAVTQLRGVTSQDSPATPPVTPPAAPTVVSIEPLEDNGATPRTQAVTDAWTRWKSLVDRRAATVQREHPDWTSLQINADAYEFAGPEPEKYIDTGEPPTVVPSRPESSPVGDDRPDAELAPWQMTRDEFDRSVWFHGTDDAHVERLLQAGHMGPAQEGRASSGPYITLSAAMAAKFPNLAGKQPSGAIVVVQPTGAWASMNDPAFRAATAEHSSEQASTLSTTGQPASVRVLAVIPREAAADPHRYLVEQALREGRPVPPNVLRDYPDLANKETTDATDAGQQPQDDQSEHPGVAGDRPPAETGGSDRPGASAPVQSPYLTDDEIGAVADNHESYDLTYMLEAGRTGHFADEHVGVADAADIAIHPTAVATLLEMLPRLPNRYILGLADAFEVLPEHAELSPSMSTVRGALHRELLKRAGQGDLFDTFQAPTASLPPVAETRNVDADGRPAGDHSGTGQLPVGGGRAPRPGRTRRPRPLGTVPAADGGGTPSAGTDGAGHGDSQGVVADQLPHGSGTVEGSDTESPDGGSDVPPSVVVPPAGTDHDPGVKHLDYVLTDERIRAVIDRGPVVRADDNLRAIKLLKQLTAEQRHATPDEQEILAKYVGWGASDMAERLGDYEDHRWSANEKRIWRELREVLTDAEREGLRGSSPYAHFTYDLYRPIWHALEHAGFTGGRVLEPSVGTGHAFGLMPADIRHASMLNGVELEPITAGIAHHLYPSARIQAVGYEKARLARGSQDLLVGNPPFGDFGLIDPRMPEIVTRRVHGYFFAKGLDHLRPGGLIVFIATHYMLDGTAPEQIKLRKYLMERAEFVGAVRLPKTAFDKSAKTEVVADIIVLRKLADGETAQNARLFIESPKHEALSKGLGYDYRGQPQAIYRSSWYDAHPELVLGTEAAEGTMRRGGEYTVKPATDFGPATIERALTTGVLTPNTYRAAADDPATQQPRPAPKVVEGDFKPGQLRVSENGKRIVKVAEDGTTSDVTPTKDGAIDQPAVARIKGMIGIRDARNVLVKAMRDPQATDAQIERLQKKLRTVYDAFVKPKSPKPNWLNAPINKRLFASDPEAANLLGLEILEFKAEESVDKNGRKVLRLREKVVGQNDIFKKRTIGAERVIDHVETPKDALLASLGVRGRIDWPYMARIAGRSVPDLKTALKDTGLVYEQPDGSVVLAEEYLSGDVVTTLEDADAAAAQEPQRFAKNVEALKAVQPTPKTADDLLAGTVDIAIGSHWVPTEYVEQFAGEQLGVSPQSIAYKVTGTEALVRWDYHAERDAQGAGYRHPLAVHYDPSRPGDANSNQRTYSYLDLLHDTLNLQQPDLGHWEGSRDARYFVKEPEAELAARANQETLRQDWKTWVFQHPEVAEHLLGIFNERFNRTVERTYDGSHMQYPGMATLYNAKGEEVHFYAHQNNGVWRILTSGNTLLAHEVGAGKTFEMIAAAMEMRRTGRARKPMIVVPTYLLSQWKQDVIRLYPTAKLLAFDEKDLEKSKRQAAMARIAHGDWDIVLVPHSSFQLLKVSEARMMAMMQQWIDELTDAIMEEHAAGHKKEPNVKQMERLRRKIQDKAAKKAEKINKGTDNALTWEELGVDALFVDEAQAFKNLYFFTKIENLRGLSRSESDRALDLYVKVQDINEQSGHRNLVLATATPVMNSIAEIFTMQRYLQPQALRQYGVENFDNWYAMFAKALPTTERQPDGAYKEVIRLTDYSNLQFLSKMVREVMDYVGWEDMPYLKLPAIRDGKIEIVQTDPHPLYPQIMEWFKQRMSRLKATPPHIDRQGNYIAPDRLDPLTGESMHVPDNILAVMTDAKKAAVDIRLILGNRAKDWPGSRLQVAADKMVKDWKAEAPHKGVVLVFLDLGTPKTPAPLSFLTDTTVEDETDGALNDEDEADETAEELEARLGDQQDAFNLYDALKNALISRGVPPAQIAYIHQAKNPAERIALFQAANEGKVRFVFASTDKGGVGMNIQTRLAAIYEIDAPRAQRPGDLRQRMGRGIRQGNNYREWGGVRLVRFVTKGTTDEWLWGLLTRKDYQLRKFYRGEAASMHDDDPSTMSLEQAQMLASNDQRTIELVELQGKMARLEAQALAGEQALGKARAGLATAKRRKTLNEADHKAVTEWLATQYTPLRGDHFAMTVGGQVYTKRVDAEVALLDAARRLIQEDRSEQSLKVGVVGHLPIYAKLSAYNVSPKAEDKTKNQERPPEPRKPEDAGYRHYSVYFHLDGSAFNGGSIDAGTLYYKGFESLEQLGVGVNIVAPIVNAYEKTATTKQRIADQIEADTKEIAQHERTLANPPTAIAELKRARTRVVELETELKGDAERESKARDAAAKAEADAKKAAAAAAQPTEDADGEDGETHDHALPLQTAPPIARAAETLRAAGKDIRATLTAPTVSEAARLSSRHLRKRLGELMHTLAFANHALTDYRNAVERLTLDHDEILRLADILETGEGELPKWLQPWGTIRAHIFDYLKKQIADLGIEKQWREHYLGHVWEAQFKDGQSATDRAMRLVGRRPLEGPKSFLKHRTIPTMRQGVARGLEPKTWNLVEIDLFKIEEMSKFILGRQALNDNRSLGTWTFVSALRKPPTGMVQIPDPIGAVWAPPQITVKEAYDALLTEGLESLIHELGIPYGRVAGNMPWLGRTNTETNEITMRVGAPEGALMHELGHALDNLYGLKRIITDAIKTGEYEGDTGSLDELRELAKLRYAGGTPTADFAKYVQKRSEQIANLVHAYLWAPDAAKRVAPRAYDAFDSFVMDHEELHPLMELQKMRSVVIAEREATYRLPGPILLGRYYAAPEVARIFKNYLTPGLGAHPVFQVLRIPSNAMVQLKLSLSRSTR